MMVSGTKPCKESKNVIFNWLKTIVTSSKTLDPSTNEYYKMNVKRKRGDDHSPPKVTFGHFRRVVII